MDSNSPCPRTGCGRCSSKSRTQGSSVPESVRSELFAPEDAVLRDADIYVDRLYANAPTLGAALLVAQHLALRGRSEPRAGRRRRRDGQRSSARASAQPRGVVWRSTTDGRPILAQPAQLRAAARAARSLLRAVPRGAARNARRAARAFWLRDPARGPFDAVDGALDAHRPGRAPRRRRARHAAAAPAPIRA